MLDADDLREKADTWRERAKKNIGSERDAALKIAEAYDQLAEIWNDGTEAAKAAWTALEAPEIDHRR